MMIIYIAGLQTIPGDLIEAAKIDGANKMADIIQGYNSDDDAIDHDLYIPVNYKRIQVIRSEPVPDSR